MGGGDPYEYEGGEYVAIFVTNTNSFDAGYEVGARDGMGALESRVKSDRRAYETRASKVPTATAIAKDTWNRTTTTEPAKTRGARTYIILLGFERL